MFAGQVSMEQMSDRKISVGIMLMDKMSFGQIFVAQPFGNKYVGQMSLHQNVCWQNVCKQSVFLTNDANPMWRNGLFYYSPYIFCKLNQRCNKLVCFSMSSKQDGNLPKWSTQSKSKIWYDCLKILHFGSSDWLWQTHQLSPLWP